MTVKAKPTRKMVQELLEKGLAPKQIAKKLNIKPATVYTYRHMFKKEEEAKMKKTESKKTETKQVATKVEKENEKLRQEVEKLKEVNGKSGDEITELREMIKGLNQEIEKLQQENRELRLRNAELIDEARLEIEAFEKQYKTEKAKHETLFTYITLGKEVV